MREKRFSLEGCMLLLASNAKTALISHPPMI